MMLTYIKHDQSRSYQKTDLSKEFHQGRLHTHKTERQPRIVVYWMKLSTKMIKLRLAVDE